MGRSLSKDENVEKIEKVIVVNDLRTRLMVYMIPLPKQYVDVEKTEKDSDIYAFYFEK